MGTAKDFGRRTPLTIVRMLLDPGTHDDGPRPLRAPLARQVSAADMAQATFGRASDGR